jgi:predicted TIM-barrel fold metal-dependent hydrolase
MLQSDNGYTILNKALRGEKLDDVFIIDVHGHLDLWKSSPVKGIECKAEGMLLNMDRVGIDMLCINKWNSPDPNANKDVANVVKRYPDCFIGFAVAFPALGPRWNREELTRCFDEYGFKGVKVHNAYTQLAMRDVANLSEFKKSMDAIWDFVNERHCPVLCHGYLSPEIAKRYPEGIFISAHAGGVRKVSEDYADCPNVFLDTASSSLMRGNIEHHVKVVGAERILYGSDMPYANPGFRLGQVIACRLPDKIMGKILGLNMARLLNIDIPEKYKGE